MSRTVFKEELCKGCALCVAACPKKILRQDESRINSKGYRLISCVDMDQCTGCAVCARSCPDVAIEVYRSL